jgi:pimeloyl-ACP methyl ester carboxylesterase
MPQPSAFGEGPAVEAFSRDGTSIALFAVQAEVPGGPRPVRWRRPALLLVHGATADHTTWRTVGPAFAATRPVFAMDRRGRGESGDRQPYSIEREFEDVAAAAEELARRHRGPIDVAGHSYGGRCALGASLLSPAIRRLVVYEGAPAPPGVSYRPPGLVEAVRDALDRGDDEGALTTFLGGIVGMSEAELAAYRANPVWPARVAAASTILREVEAEASPAASIEALGRVSVPVLLLLGSVSRSPFGIGTDALAAALAQPEIAVIDGAAHAAHHTHPGEFIGIVLDFLDRG